MRVLSRLTLKRLVKVSLVTAFILTAGCTVVTTSQPNDPAINLTGAARTNIDLGMVFLKKEDMINAKASFLTALRESPRLPAAWYSMAYYYEVTGNLTKADKYYKKAVKLGPRQGAPLNNYGTFLCRHGKYKKAIQEFITAANNQNYLDTAGAYENAGLCATMIPNNATAMIYFKKALLNDPKRPTSLLYLAKLNYKTGNIHQARTYFKRYKQLASSPMPPDARKLAKALS